MPNRKLVRFLALCPFVFSGVVEAQVAQPRLQCAQNTEVCMNACMQANETSNLLLDCKRSCSQFNDAQRGFCFTRSFNNDAPTRDEANRRAAAQRCQQACQAQGNSDIDVCAAILQRRDPKLRWVTPDTCGEQALARAAACYRNCFR